MPRRGGTKLGLQLRLLLSLQGGGDRQQPSRLEPCNCMQGPGAPACNAIHLRCCACLDTRALQNSTALQPTRRHIHAAQAQCMKHASAAPPRPGPPGCCRHSRDVLLNGRHEDFRHTTAHASPVRACMLPAAAAHRPNHNTPIDRRRKPHTQSHTLLEPQQTDARWALPIYTHSSSGQMGLTLIAQLHDFAKLHPSIMDCPAQNKPQDTLQNTRMFSSRACFNSSGCSSLLLDYLIAGPWFQCK